MIIPLVWLIHTVSVRPLTGRTGTGPVYGPAVTVRCLVDEQTKVVRADAGEEVVSSATLFVQPSAEASLPTGSQVTLPSGKVTRVLSYARRDAGGLGPFSHGEAACE